MHTQSHFRDVARLLGTATGRLLRSPSTSSMIVHRIQQVVAMRGHMEHGKNVPNVYVHGATNDGQCYLEFLLTFVRIMK